MHSPSNAGTVVGAGRGALIMAMAGAGWLGCSLASANGFNGFTGPVLGFGTLGLLVCSVYTIQRGRSLRKNDPAASQPAGQAFPRQFFVVLVVEALAIIVVLAITLPHHRADLGVTCCCIVIGLHYLPLAKVFRAPILRILGIFITLWCVFCLVSFHHKMLVISASAGTGFLLWVAAIAALLRARKIMGSMTTIEVPSPGAPA